MGTDGSAWIVSRTARAPSNIAVIKYWGKRDEDLILPLNSSISVTLDPNDLSATTTVSTSPDFDADRLWLNDKEVSLSSHRYVSCLKELRDRATDVKDEKTGIVITKEDWKHLKLHIVSKNNFPTAAGLASSAAGFACLVFTVAELMGIKESFPGELSTIARRGSGSACRSLHGGFVKWEMGKRADGKDSIAVPLAEHHEWDDLRIVICVVSSRQKEVSSTSGMQESVQTSPLLHYRAKEVVPKRITEMEEALSKRDFSSFAKLTCADSNQFHATCLDTSPPIFYMNDTSRRIIGLVERWNKSEGSPQAAYTFDAGPNAVIFVPQKSGGALLHRLLYEFPPPEGMNLSSYVVGSTELLEALGIDKLEDIRSLERPIESPKRDEGHGELAYLICTRPGNGASLCE
ncbi:hypothetical protein SELMODRAFT_135101 [Selaginella moellendorffii]|uniref:Diphosphomevalonate decarboxylase n=1 Tax=Selaginella moellendorffii TaxID=88036 RepID=D8T9Q4_SELML|nr:diphosphomevalonate decarboxylase MVD2, peroxisomal [Selaginella moellendorffii]EFJ06620.1 hypothetical protein SELMODRAFT_135101 [Selaginella moellendorffii]|eukprot:XP_002992344.1 diphosphomevalonate decarboxylase MVD2, peroxisomal [Selaginella moellendorffii]